MMPDMLLGMPRAPRMQRAGFTGLLYLENRATAVAGGPLHLELEAVDALEVVHHVLRQFEDGG